MTHRIFKAVKRGADGSVEVCPHNHSRSSLAHNCAVTMWGDIYGDDDDRFEVRVLGTSEVVARYRRGTRISRGRNYGNAMPTLVEVED